MIGGLVFLPYRLLGFPQLGREHADKSTLKIAVGQWVGREQTARQYVVRWQKFFLAAGRH